MYLRMSLSLSLSAIVHNFVMNLIRTSHRSLATITHSLLRSFPPVHPIKIPKHTHALYSHPIVIHSHPILTPPHSDLSTMGRESTSHIFSCKLRNRHADIPLLSLSSSISHTIYYLIIQFMSILIQLNVKRT